MTGKGYRASLMAACATFALGAELAFATQVQAREGIAQGAAVDEQSTQPVTSVDEIIVTARRRDERLIDAPVAISAIGGKTLATYSVTRVSDLATMVPSLIAGKAASGSSASIFLRGVGSTALSAGFDQSVSFVMDGLPMSRGRELSLPQYDIQRVEVLKGPQALFYGKNTTGGLISIVTNDATATPEAGIKAGYGFKAKDRYVEGYVSGPLSDTLRARLAGRYSKSDGAFTNSAAETYTDPLGMQRHRNADRRGGQEVYSARGTLDWDASENLTFQLKAGLTSLKDGGPTDVLERICGGGRTTPFAANGIPPSPNADCKVNGVADSSSIPTQVASANYRYARDGKMYADFASQFAALTSNLTVGKFGITSITSYYHFKQTDLNNVSGEAYPATFTQLADFEQFAEEVRFQSKFEGPFNVLFGAFYSKGDFDFNTDAYIFPVPLDPKTGTYTTFKRDNGFKSESFSVFGEGTLTLATKFELAAGARWSHEARDSYQYSLPANVAFAAAFPGNIRLKDKFKDDNLSPQVSLRYKPETDTTFYAAYKQGFKSGGFNISQALSVAASVDAGRFGSETAEGGEIGLRTIRFNHDLQLNVTAFQYVYKDLQVQTFDPQTVSLIADNAGKLRTRGVEGDVNWRVPTVPGLSLRAAAAYNDVQYQDYVGQCYSGQTIAAGCNLQMVAGAYTAQNYDGRTPPKAPKFAGRVGASYERELSANATLRMSGDVSRTSKYNFTDTLRPDGWQPGYTKVDAAISVSGPGDRWTLALIGKNLTNELVVTSANDIPFAGGTGTGTNTGILADMSAFVENPREILLELSLKF
jgi:outer membrane receptor protein involved in Fe transport